MSCPRCGEMSATKLVMAAMEQDMERESVLGLEEVLA